MRGKRLLNGYAGKPMNYALVIIWFAVGYTVATSQYLKKIEREQAIRDRYKWQLGKGIK
jgi:hypothetical protein